MENNEFNQETQQSQQTNAYQAVQTPASGNGNSNLEVPLSLGEWVITIILANIPCVNIIMLLVWSFSQGGNTSRKNYARAMLILVIVCFVLSLIFSSALVAMIASLVGSGMNY